MRSRLPFLLMVCVLAGQAGGLFAVNFLQEGEKNLQNDKPREALVYLEAALGEGPPSEKLLLYLALAYERTNLREEAKKMLKRGIALAGPQQYLFHYNLGGLEFGDGDFQAAAADFSEAARLRPSFADAVLNRANSRLSLQDWSGASEDFKRYLVLAPENSQKDKIEELLRRLAGRAAAEEEAKKLALAQKAAEEAKKKQLEEEKAAEAARLAAEAEKKRQADAEAARLAEEKRKQDELEKARLAEEARKLEEQRQAEAEKARLAEAQRQAEEAAKLAAAEAQRQAELLAKIKTSLLGASEDSEKLSTGTAGIKKPEEEFTLDE